MIGQELLHKLCGCYDFRNVRSVHHVYRGTSNVFRLRCDSGGSETTVAVKISKPCAQADIMRKEAGKKLLDRVSAEFPFVPRLLSPGALDDDLGIYSWGFSDKRRTSVEVSVWVDCLSYRGTNVHLRNAGGRYAQLQRALGNRELDVFHPHFVDAEAHLAVFSSGGFGINGDFSFATFRTALERDVSRDRALSFVRAHALFLEMELQSTKVELEKKSGLVRQQDIVFIHAESSPSNVGFRANGEAAMIFDFDSLRAGIRAQDLAWMVNSFCIDHRRSADEARARIDLLLSSIDSAFGISPEERDLLLVFMRIGYLEALHRKLSRRYLGHDRRMGFAKEDILALQWLNKHDAIIS